MNRTLVDCAEKILWPAVSVDESKYHYFGVFSHGYYRVELKHYNAWRKENGLDE